MTRKKLNPPLEDPPKAASSDEEEQISDDSSSDEEDDDLMNPANIPSSAKNSKSEKPISSVTKPKAGSPASRRKRPIETTSSVNAKRAKIAEETTKKKKPTSSSQRLWSEEDEISLLQGMIDFKADTGKSPYEEMDRFYELTSKSISFRASKIQFVDKIRSLKRKYMGKLKRGVEESSLINAHDVDFLRLAEHIWGSHGLALDSNVKKKTEKKVVEEVTPGSAAKSNGTPKKSKKKAISVEGDGEKVEENREVLVNGDKDKEVLIDAGGGAAKSLGVMRASDWFEDSFLVGSIAGLGVSERFLKEKWSMVTVETKKRMEEKWKLLQDKEMELVLNKTDFMREIGSVIADAS
ncbi:hypothetical protein HA466_0179650 [Hirschfeldia incana]|nr:hypothetical protein HA466_0179650 [Hirschfeldia incana]